jgi:hypothetical protein
MEQAEKNDKGKKQILLRMSPSLWTELNAWAEDDFRSLNGQIEYLLTECVRQRKKGRTAGSDRPEAEQ